MSLYQERTAKLEKTLAKELESIGIYKAASSQTLSTIPGVTEADETGKVPDMDMILLEEKGTIHIQFAGFINDFAFTDRVLRPEDFEVDKQIEMNAPREEEIMSALIDEDISNGWDDSW